MDRLCYLCIFMYINCIIVSEIKMFCLFVCLIKVAFEQNFIV